MFIDGFTDRTNYAVTPKIGFLLSLITYESRFLVLTDRYLNLSIYTNELFVRRFTVRTDQASHEGISHLVDYNLIIV